MSSFELMDLPNQERILPPLKRPPSYSDSYYILNGGPRTPLELTPVPEQQLQTQLLVNQEPIPVQPRIYLFFIKSAIHLFLISVFETLFFFQYVSVTENKGVIATIDTYYTPLIQTCPSWSNATKEVIEYFLTQGNEYTMIQMEGQEASLERSTINNALLGKSLIASGVCLGVVIGGSVWLGWKKIPVRWKVLFLENITMVSLLGMYEYFFFRFIIYNYQTLSTPELNAYLVKGLFNCLNNE